VAKAKGQPITRQLRKIEKPLSKLKWQIKPNKTDAAAPTEWERATGNLRKWATEP
jgi:hypothetical protein